MSRMASTEPSLYVAASKDALPNHLNNAIYEAWKEVTKTRKSFTIALSGGSLPSLLSSLSDIFAEQGKDPSFGSWHVFLADERCVPSNDPDSNLGSLQGNFLQHVPIPPDQIYGINESKLSSAASSAAAIAAEYETVLKNVLENQSDGKLDLAVLGFGPDGHTCSLFPGHPLLHEKDKWVASIEDSPKPPPKRITLTLPVLNEKTRHIIFCGAGSSKSPILQKVFAGFGSGTAVREGTHYSASLAVPPPYPCAMVVPQTNDGSRNTLTWVVDADAVHDLSISPA